MKTPLVFAAGAAAGVYGMVKVRRLAEALTPDGMRDRIGAAVVGVRIFRDEVVHGQAEAESHLRERLRTLESGPRQLTQAPAPSTHRTSTTALTAARTEEGPS